ncbi:MAG: general secretion pathway protein GspD [Planctomycetes bacterium]|nr:general secretion pathway protein GspD [Planctomycetota bacterium]
MRTKLSVASTLFAALCVTPYCDAAPASGSTSASGRAQSSVVKPMTRDDVELMLREARAAISNGKFDEAEKLVTRAENARIHYSMFHFGPTPASVRRELNRARRTDGPANNRVADGESSAFADSTQRQQLNAFAQQSDAASRREVDPFTARSLASGANSTPPGGPTAQNASPNLAADPLNGERTPPIGRPQRLPSLSQTVRNPFAKPTSGEVAPARYEVDPALGSSGAQLVQHESEAPNNVSWTLPGSQPDRPANGAVPNVTAGQRDPSAGLPTGAERSGASRTPPQAPAPIASGAQSIYAPKDQALSRMTEARQALDAGNFDVAEKLSREVSALGVSESEFLPNEDRPSILAWDIVRAKQSRGAQPAAPSAAAAPAAAPSTPSRYADQPAQPVASKLEVTQFTEAPTPSADENSTQPLDGEELPAPLFGSPINTPDEPLSVPANEAAQPPRKSSSLMDAAEETEMVLARQLSAEIGKRQSEAKRLRTEDPERALTILHEAQQLVKDSKLPESSQRELLGRIDITLNETEQYVKQHGADIELDKQNEAVLSALDRDRELKRKIQQQIAEGIEEFNTLRDEHRYAEAEIVARRLFEIAPEDPTVLQVFQTAKFIRREMMNRELADAREQGNWEAFTDVERASITNVGDDNPLTYDNKRWTDFAMKRKGSRDRTDRRTERELEIEQKLKSPVQLRYEDAPLSQVVDELSKLTGVNIHLDPRGLSQEAVNSDTTVTLNLTKEISLESALNLILEPLHLSYVVKDDVLKITSEQLRDGEIYPVTYNVSDLVIPIPNFVPNSDIGLQGLINEAHAAAGHGQRGIGSSGPSVLVNSPGQQPSATANGNVLAQQFNAAPTAGMSPSTVPIGAGPGGMGAGANADFDSLIDLIVSTVSTDTWAENGGGEAEIRPFPTNLSLVISQTQAVHEEIADLLEQLRRLQDLQVTIEVRFIRLNDSFFERIGIDFDMDINDNGVNPAQIPNIPFQPFGPGSNTVGLLPPAGVNVFPNFTTDLDIPFRQDGFNLALPPFGGYDANSAARFGFAILSDIEAFFLIEAAQGDRRTNVLNAPKVTLFNGQQAFVADATQRPFVVGVIPVVGEFAAAQQPVIVVLNEGTMMTIQAVVSEDRRYVRMTIVPFFTQIGDVDEFTFEGSSSSTSSSSSSDDNQDGKNESKDESKGETRSGVTVQLPSFSFVSVVTTVSVPDGGTVLLGGIKRLNEGRNEFGVPLLSKVPYINRLFRNVGIGRTTDSLMMMVTPRIIIQEEEEQRLGIQVP